MEDSTIVYEVLSKIEGKLIDDAATFSEFITKIVYYRIEDEVTTFEQVQNVFTRFMITDSATVDDLVTAKVGFVRGTEDFMTTSEFIAMKPKYTLSDSIIIATEMSNVFPRFVRDDVVQIDDEVTAVVRFVRETDDSMTFADSISKKAIYRLSDSAITHDEIVLIGLLIQKDSLTIDDEIFVKVKHNVFDSVNIDDSISKRLFYTIFDSVSVDDPIAMKAMIRLIDGAQAESITAAEFVTKKTFWNIEDSTAIEDSISKRVFFTISDTVTIHDLSAAKSKFNMADSIITSEFSVKKTFWSVEDSTTIDDFITKRVFLTTSDTVLVDDPIAMKAMIRLIDGAKGDSLTTSDLLIQKTFWEANESASISDSITKRVFYGISDTVTIHDLSTAKSKFNIADSLSTSDLKLSIFFLSVTPPDFTNIDDSISMRVFSTTSDTVSTDDHASFKASIRTLHDSVTFAESDIFIIFITVVPPDSANIDDSISKKVFIRLTDGTRAESTTIADLTSFKAFTNMEDTSTIDDRISKRVLYTVSDEVTVDDAPSFRASIRSLHDSVTNDDEISSKAIYNIEDSLTMTEPVIFSIFQTVTPPELALIDDFISKKIFVRLTDGARAESTTVDESILLKGAILIETRDENDNLIPGFEYLVSPNPFTGIGSLTVVDGGAGDNDTVNDGRVRVYYVPLDLYRINQTSVPAGNSSLYNFTYTTVHLTEINATALFRAVDSTTDLRFQAPIVADIIDIDVPPGFDSIISSTNVTKVRNGIHTQITNVTEMPAPIFAGVFNDSAKGNATAAQYSLVYLNMNLTANETPEDIQDAFGLTQYDAGQLYKLYICRNLGFYTRPHLRSVYCNSTT